LVEQDDVVEIAILKKHVRLFSIFAKKNGLPVYRVNRNEGIELAKTALNSPVLEKLTEGLINIYRDIPKEEYIDIDAVDSEETEESEEEFDLPPKGEDDVEEEIEEE